MKPQHTSLNAQHLSRKMLTGYAAFMLAIIGGLALVSGCVPSSLTNDAHAPLSQANDTSAPDSFTGQWLVEFITGEDKIQLTLHYGSDRLGHSHHSSNSFHITPDQLQGLTREQAMSGGSHVQFQLKRDAGAFNFDGWFKDGQGSGHYTFSINPAFATELNRQGYGTPTAEQQFHMALNNVGFAFIAELKAQGYERATLNQLVEMGQHGVGLDYLQGLKSLGYKLASIDLLIEMRDHGVSPDFIREIKGLGYNSVSVDQLITLRDHGVNAAYIRKAQARGYNNLSLEQLILMRDRGDVR